MYRTFALRWNGQTYLSTPPCTLDEAMKYARRWEELNRADRTSPVKRIEVRSRSAGIALRIDL